MGAEGSMVSDMVLVAAAAEAWWLDNGDCECGMRASMISQGPISCAGRLANDGRDRCGRRQATTIDLQLTQGRQTTAVVAWWGMRLVVVLCRCRCGRSV